MGLFYNNQTRRWKVTCDMDNCPSEYSCSDDFIKNDRGFLKKDLTNFGWRFICHKGELPKFICVFHKL